MKKYLLIIFLSLLLNFNVYANKTKFVKGNSYEGRIYFKTLEYDLPEGKWKFITQSRWVISTISFHCIDLLQVKQKIFKGLISFCAISSGGKYTHDLAQWMLNSMKKGKYDSCILRPEYNYTNLWSKGMAMNCFMTRHYDMNKELNFPDDPENFSHIQFRNYIQDKKIILPKTSLASSHTYYAPNVNQYGISVDYIINPELHGGPKIIFGDESKSEYHRENIDNYPKVKKYMNNWTKVSAIRHKEFEASLSAKDSHKLNFSDLDIDFDGNNYIKKKKKKQTIISSKMIYQLRELKKLYDEGVLTKEEFTKAKKKILD